MTGVSGVAFRRQIQNGLRGHLACSEGISVLLQRYSRGLVLGKSASGWSACVRVTVVVPCLAGPVLLTCGPRTGPLGGPWTCFRGSVNLGGMDEWTNKEAPVLPYYVFIIF